MIKKNIYITTTLPYVNDEPHLGFAMEIIRADTLVRFYRLIDFNVFFNTGTDEHGLKIYQKAKEQKKDSQTFCNLQAKKFEELKNLLDLSYNSFIRTTDKNHIQSAQKFWLRCLKNGDIYKAKYKRKYCVGCEMEKNESDLINNYCPLHPNRQLQIIEEENYFFRFSKYQRKLLNFYQKNKDFVVPSYRFEELINFVKGGLRDFSISRLKEKMPWGIPVPNNKNHVMYVWFDALVNYISALGWPKNEKNFKKFWPGIQIAGKDNLRQQSAIWQAMLMSAGLPNSKKIYIEGFITINGQKMSKSLGNFIAPIDLVKKYGTEAVRYYLLKEIPPFEDGDFSYQRLTEVYNADLANELGNLTSRLTNLAQNDNLNIPFNSNVLIEKSLSQWLENFQFNQALNYIWKKIKELNQQLDKYSPWNKSKTKRKNFLNKSIKELNAIGQLLQPFLPKTAQTIIKHTMGKIKKAPILFPKIK